MDLLAYVPKSFEGGFRKVRIHGILPSSFRSIAYIQILNFCPFLLVIKLKLIEN